MLVTCRSDHIAVFASKSSEFESSGEREVPGQLDRILLPDIFHVTLCPAVCRREDLKVEISFAKNKEGRASKEKGSPPATTMTDRTLSINGIFHKGRLFYS